MTIGSVKPSPAEAPAAAVPAREPGDGGDFAAVARAIAAGNLDAARAALPSSPAATATAPAGTLAGTLADGNLAAARLALAQLGTDPYTSSAPVADRHDAPRFAPANPGNGAPYMPPATPYVPGTGYVAPPPTDATIAHDPGAAGRVAGQLPAGFMIADVGATMASAAPVAPRTTSQTAGPTAQSANGGSYDVTDILLALATGNAGGIPPDLINRYGPGGALYDPAAIMDAYRSSTIGQAQMARNSWIGKPA